jgi:phosphate transport system protein
MVALGAYGRGMRTAFTQDLDGIFVDLVDICGLVEQAVVSATEALLTGDRARAEEVISADAAIDTAREQVEESAFSLLLLQQPVATDLRVVVAALRMVTELERMGDLSVHVAKIARLRVPDLAVPESLRPTIAQMATVAQQMVHRVAAVIADRDLAAAAALAAEDEQMDQLRRSTFTELLASDWPHGVEAAIDIALLGRYYERIADHAVSIANRVVYVVTGDTPETPPAY